MDIALANIFKRNMAGLYFGPRGIVIVQQSGGKVGTYQAVPYPEQPESEGVSGTEDIFEVFKNNEIELIAFLQKAIRDSRLETTDVIVSLPPKDLIVRFFEMPNIPRSEIVAGINFEMKKYIPFKVEELAYDFQFRVRPKTNVIEVILCGVRQEPLNRYMNLFGQLNLSVQAYEPGLFSLFRLLTIRKKIAPQKSYVILEFDKEEANILVIEKDFPYFTRDIKLVLAPAGATGTEDFDAVLFRLINEVRVSLDYYRRQFMKREVDEMIVVSQSSFSGWADHFSRELGVTVKFIATQDLVGAKGVPDDMLAEMCKSLGAALRPQRPSLVTLNLGRAKERAGKTMLSFGDVTRGNMEKVVMDFVRGSQRAIQIGLVGGLLFILTGYGLSFSKLFPLERELQSALIQQTPLLPGLDLSTLDAVKASELTIMEKKRVLSALVDDYRPFYTTLVALSKSLPKGVWLDTLSFLTTEGKPLMSMMCVSYDASARTRSDRMNTFIMNLRKDPLFSKLFSSIELKSYREVDRKDLYYLQFDVYCSQKTGK